MKFENFNLVFESLMKSLDEKNGLHWPNVKSFEFLKNALFFNENGLITEDLDVFPIEMFRNALALFNDINTNVKMLKQSEFLETIDNAASFKDNKLENDNIIVLKFNFKSYSQLLNCLRKAFNKTIEELKDDADVNEFYENLFNGSCSASLTETTDGNMHYSVFLLDKDNYSLNVVRHECIHYLQKCFGVGIVENMKYLKVNTSNETYGLLKNENLMEVFNGKEMIPYIHNICYAFEENGIHTLNEALQSFDKFMKNEDESPEEYISRCKSLDEYEWFENERTPIHMLMLAVIYRRNLKIFKTIIGKYFSRKE